MNAQDYLKYQAAVQRGLEGLSFVSTGACMGCEECGIDEDSTIGEQEIAGEPHFSWHACDCCGSRFGGDRHPAHGWDKNGEIIHFEVCADCLYFINYGQLDDMTMLEIDKSA